MGCDWTGTENLVSDGDLQSHWEAPSQGLHTLAPGGPIWLTAAEKPLMRSDNFSRSERDSRSAQEAVPRAPPPLPVLHLLRGTSCSPTAANHS